MLEHLFIHLSSSSSQLLDPNFTETHYENGVPVTLIPDYKVSERLFSPFFSTPHLASSSSLDIRLVFSANEILSHIVSWQTVMRHLGPRVKKELCAFPSSYSAGREKSQPELRELDPS